MNFLIIGAAGFLGSSLTNQLAREGHQVRRLGDLSTADSQSLAPHMHFTQIHRCATDDSYLRESGQLLAGEAIAQDQR